MRFARWGGARTLPLGVHAGRFRPARQHPFGEVQALLHVAHLLPQSPHVGVERGELLGHFERSLEPAVAGTAPQALGPQPEHQRERRVNRGMPGLARADREPDSDQVDGAQRDGDRKPNRGFEGHGATYVMSWVRKVYWWRFSGRRRACKPMGVAPWSAR